MSAGPRGRFQRLRSIVHGYVLSHCPICSAANWAPHKAAQHTVELVGGSRDAAHRAQSGAANAGDCPGSETLDARSAAEACDRLCNWVHRYNALRLQDPFDRPRRNGPVIAHFQ